MLKMGRYIYIHFLTIAMVIFFVLNGHITELLCAYFSMLLHETAHTVAAACIGLNISHIALYPFGVNLKLKNKLVANISDELILYLSGPAVNVILALISVLFRNSFEPAAYMYYTNMLLCAVNLLPVLPLDGGCVIKRILSDKIGTVRAEVYMKKISCILVVVLMLAGAYVMYATGYNYSVLLLSVMLMGNIFTQRQKYNTEYIRELMFYRDKPIKKVKLTAAYADEDVRDIAKSFMPGAYSLVCEMERDGKINGFRSETEIIEKILKK